MPHKDVSYNYSLLAGDNSFPNCILEFIQGFPDDFKLFKGHSVAKEWPANVSFKMDMDKHFKKHIKLTDHLLNSSNVIIASKRFQEFLRNEKVPNLEFLPVTIFNQQNKVASK